MDWQPKISVVIPVYNGSNYVAQAIDSALDQTYKNTEVIVVNDGSTDNGATEAIVKKYGDRVRYYSKPNGGIASTLNFGVEHMTGEYFSWLSHDDVFESNKLARQVEILQSQPNRETIIYGDYLLINDRAEIVGKKNNVHIEPDDFYLELFLRFPVHGCTSLIPKSAFTRFGGFSAEWKYLQDTEMWFRLAPHFTFIHIPEKMARVRIHPQQATTTRAALGYREANLLYRQELDRLSADDIRRIMHQPPYKFYLACASAFTAHSFFDVASYAVRQASKALRAEPNFALQVTIPFRQASIAILGQLQRAKHAIQKTLPTPTH